MNNAFGKITELESLEGLFHSGMTIMYGGFGGVGNPPDTIDFLLGLGIKDLTLIGNDTAFPEIGIGKLITYKRARRVVVSHIGSNPNAGSQMTDGELEVEFCPQGILMERIRAGGSGLRGILSRVGIEHEVIKGNKQTVLVDGLEYMIETGLTADISIVFAKKADEFGNLVFDKSARNTNPLVAMAGDITIVEAEEIVPAGTLDPETIVTPGVYVDYIVPSNGVNWKWAWE